MEFRMRMDFIKLYSQMQAIPLEWLGAKISFALTTLITCALFTLEKLSTLSDERHSKAIDRSAPGADLLTHPPRNSSLLQLSAIQLYFLGRGWMSQHSEP
jgi:hypothetical protein